MIKRLTVLFAVVALTSACEDKDTTSPAANTLTGRRIYAVDTGNNLVLFGSGSAPTINRRTMITGLQAGEQVLGIDFRPTTATGGAATDVGQLFGITSLSRVVRIDTVTAAATVTGALVSGTPAAAYTLMGSAFGVDFNPSVDRIRVHAEGRQNLRLNQTANPVAVTVDTVLAYVAGDAGAGINAQITATAYTPAAFGGTTTLLGVDAQRDVLVLSTRPNGGTLQTVVNLPMGTSTDAGFDIASDGIGYITLTAAGSMASRLYIVSGITGTPVFSAAGDVGAVLRGIAVAP